MIPQTFELVTHPLCPYVQRSVIVLLEKNLPYRRIDIDLANKPDWFHQRSPLGKVPVLITGDNRSLFESAVICEYLNEITPGDLHPSDALERAEHRAWIEFGSDILKNIAQLYNAKTEQAFNHQRQQLRRQLEQLDNRVVAAPFFSGDIFHIIDAVYGPIFRYFDVIDRVLPLALFEGLEKVQNWRYQLRQRPSVQQAVAVDYPQRLLGFLEDRGSYLSERLSHPATGAS
ncbi:glutathione S-transferase family protein [Marinobacterium arenosum]|uniref:glutathione S-transferase family protein n=1 Tax=Marinobacterium arenosum TaxID=2862496 RepID=UPI001C96F89E|nr:glutathione S-transferase family protein [Marinobacterium arenosum]MBY4676384.1 glutathione S-transferase family protein [Marinobacterium arenosum]